MRPGAGDYDSREGYGAQCPTDRGSSRPAPRVLSTKASLDIGYEPVGTYVQTIPHQVDWLVKAAAAGAVPGADDPSFGHYVDYAREEQFTGSCPGRTRHRPL
ncbi:hypothetical protein ACFVTM_06940 [Arthrobacter sp. NPDC058130]|uniref:hypothetical protein n=1 Tax=Arthrobacter sp. NPDC058130 TaxID=3346353 RepID=UPI0036ED6729